MKADVLLADIATNATLYLPKKKIKKLKDADDDMILELAQESKANFNITGNTNDFTIPKFKKTRMPL